MKIIIEREDLEKLISLYVKSKLKTEANLTDAIITYGKENVQVFLSSVNEVRMAIKDEK